MADEARHERLPVQTGRIAAFDLLHAELADHANLYRNGSRQDQRNAVASTIMSLAKYLKSRGFAEPTYEPLMRPLLALTERELNIIDPLFSERKRSSRPKRSLEQLEQMGAMAALANAWLALHKDSDGKLDDKLAAVARRLSGDWFGKPTVSQIKVARELVSQEAKDHPAVQFADLFTTHIKDAGARFGEEVAVEMVAHFLNKLRAREK